MWAVLALSRTVGEMSPIAHAQMHQLLGGVQKSVGVSSNSDAQMPQSIARRTSRSPSVSLVFRGEDGASEFGWRGFTELQRNILAGFSYLGTVDKIRCVVIKSELSWNEVCNQPSK